MKPEEEADPVNRIHRWLCCTARLLLIVIALLATWLPARRAASIDPMEAFSMDNADLVDNTDKVNISLEYNPTRDDVSHQLVKGRNRLPQTPFFARRQFAGKNTDYFVHGNSRIKVYEDGKDASTYGTWRWWRISHLTDGLNPDDGPPQNDWADDNVSKIPNWIDIPGYKFAESPNRWKSNSYLLEFIVSVSPYKTAIDALYFYVIVSL